MQAPTSNNMEVTPDQNLKQWGAAFHRYWNIVQKDITDSLAGTVKREDDWKASAAAELMELRKMRVDLEGERQTLLEKVASLEEIIRNHPDEIQSAIAETVKENAIVVAERDAAIIKYNAAEAQRDLNGTDLVATLAELERCRKELQTNNQEWERRWAHLPESIAGSLRDALERARVAPDTGNDAVAAPSNSSDVSSTSSPVAHTTTQRIVRPTIRIPTTLTLAAARETAQPYPSRGPRTCVTCRGLGRQDASECRGSIRREYCPRKASGSGKTTT
ncbi:hypothetical protein MKEN_00316700 [Mycena kentingensis (nom. inval.)]|nr:hypothetical protein MKEN_00316700 [Mycena kentingensis (nom. inval.)]